MRWSATYYFEERPSGKEVADAMELIWFEVWGNVGTVYTDSGGEFDSESWYTMLKR